jgi:hypothetical protein
LRCSLLSIAVVVDALFGVRSNQPILGWSREELG